MTKITFIFGNSTDPTLFEDKYQNNLKQLFLMIPGTIKQEFAKAHPKEDGTLPPFYRLVDLCFSSYEDACNAVKTEEAQKLFPEVFAISAGDVKILFSQVEQ